MRDSLRAGNASCATCKTRALATSCDTYGHIIARRLDGGASGLAFASQKMSAQLLTVRTEQFALRATLYAVAHGI
jgi:hypothetical protein